MQHHQNQIDLENEKPNISHNNTNFNQHAKQQLCSNVSNSMCARNIVFVPKFSLRTLNTALCSQMLIVHQQAMVHETRHFRN